MEEATVHHLHGRTLHDYLTILMRRRWTILAVFACVFTYGALRTFTEIPIYKATVQLLIERQAPRILSQAEGLSSEASGYGEEFYQTHYKLLESKSLVQKVVAKLDLKNDPHYRAIFQSLPANADAAVKQRAEENLIGAIAGGVEVSPVRQSSLVNISFSHPDPVFATTLVNTLAQCYIEQSLELRFAASQEAEAWLKQKLVEGRKKLEDSESVLNQYKREHQIVALEDKENITAQKLEKLNQDLLSAQTHRMAAETRFKEVSQGKPISEVLNNPLITLMKGQEAKLMAEQSELSRKYGADHPRMLQLSNELATTRSKIGAETSQVVQAIKNEYSMAKAQEENLKKALEAQKSDTQDMSDRTIQYRVLLRDVETNRALYENMLKSLKATTATENLPAINIRIVYPATVPGAPISPNARRNLTMAAVLGLVLGVGLALGLESLNTTLKTPEEVEGFLKVANLAMIPHLEFPAGAGASGQLPELVVNNNEHPAAAEFYRGLRTTILLSSPEQAPHIVLITSTTPLEGKSLTSANLAAVMAKAEQDVLLVDADLRRPSLHELFQVPSEPGLSNFLVGEFDDLNVLTTPVPHLFLIPSGKIPPHPSELLGSERMIRFLDLAKKRFSRIIIDSPPLMSVTDAAILGTRADGVILVIRAEATPRKAVLDARDRLLNVNANILGTVLNDVPIKRHGYSYNNYYYRYSSYYASTENTPTSRRFRTSSHPGALSWVKDKFNNLRKRL
jgi:polysaccharide biosynthesis transport protein